MDLLALASRQCQRCSPAAEAEQALKASVLSLIQEIKREIVSERERLEEILEEVSINDPASCSDEIESLEREIGDCASERWTLAMIALVGLLRYAKCVLFSATPQPSNSKANIEVEYGEQPVPPLDFRYMQKNLRQSALSRGHLFWARGPDNAGYYNSRPHETGFFCDGGDYDSYYGRFFLNWYSGILIDHVDQVLSLATLAFDGTEIVVKIPSIYWWYRTASHAAELTAGFYNPTNRDGYSPVFRMLKKHSVILKLVCYGPEFTVQENDEAFADPEGLTWQVMNAAWDQGLSISIESALPCLDGEMYSQILDTAKPRNDPDRHHVSFFAYRQLPPFLLQRDVCFSELENFVKCMHGEATQNVEG